MINHLNDLSKDLLIKILVSHLEAGEILMLPKQAIIQSALDDDGEDIFCLFRREDGVEIEGEWYSDVVTCLLEAEQRKLLLL